MMTGRDGNESPTCVREARFHSVVLSSVDDATSCLPSGEKDSAAMLALATWRGGLSDVPRTAFHSRTWPFSVPRPSTGESGDIAIAVAWFVSRRRKNWRPERASQPATVDAA